ncbi:MAG: HAMP domain-containing protein [Burkholderiales bacterium]|nr:HAMP domain-containing protein [Burkholderiales bacterium]
MFNFWPASLFGRLLCFLVALIALVLIVMGLLFQYDRENLLIYQFGHTKAVQLQALRAALDSSIPTERADILRRFGHQYNARLFEERRRRTTSQPSAGVQFDMPFRNEPEIPSLDQDASSNPFPFRSNQTPIQPRQTGQPPSGAFLDLEKYLQKTLGSDTMIRLQPERQLLWVRFSARNNYYWAGFILPDRPLAKDVPSRAFFLALVIVAMLVLAALAFARYLSQPLTKLAEAVNLVGRGEVPPPLPDAGPSEMAALNRGFNAMITRLQQVEHDRALLLAGVSHDLRTPLARLRLSVEMSHDDPQERDLMIDDIEAIDRIIDQFLDFARNDDGKPAHLQNINALIASSVERYQRSHYDVRFTPGSKLPDIPVRTTAFERLINNLINNAITHGKPPIEITTGFDAHQVWVEVSDHGSGFPEAERERLKEPFRRASKARSTPEGKLGAGLGLAIVERIARLHSGSVELLSAPHGGALIKVLLPRHPASSARRSFSPDAFPF